MAEVVLVLSLLYTRYLYFGLCIAYWIFGIVLWICILYIYLCEIEEIYSGRCTIASIRSKSWIRFFLSFCQSPVSERLYRRAFRWWFRAS
ncbi:hypothetical protein BDV37DRAFT_210575 [Aspergillus pseudonomiae]|uniref:Uncharacterized protein n=1 Tax=Aspergillus pseudonomiae TaxID=1506151 RepID=A0A5N7D1I6_9EURO|nr:uncharacterized protein BDV37DRAFT_210575 [Aspergillus pseudonomiae]KAE8400276.1 hypothetical protein BDV37DRAFT_210575 [Aspergillus pseudonomiae]